MSSSKPRIGVVGPCKSGKSTLVRGLQQSGYEAIQIAQEHSSAPSMWQVIAKPDLLIYLQSEYETTLSRGITWLRSEYDEQQPRLKHARDHADLVISTDGIEEELVLGKVLDYIQNSLSQVDPNQDAGDRTQ